MAKVCMNAVCLKASIADSDSTRSKGLMFRKELPENQAMLFIFDKEGPYGFWMKNTFIPLDIIWVSRDKEIVDIHAGALPCQKDPCRVITPRLPAKYVVEVNAGFTEKHKVKIGDKVRFKSSYD
jgi:uncharacterized membrane protein (UPF0127 family)